MRGAARVALAVCLVVLVAGCESEPEPPGTPSSPPSSTSPAPTPPPTEPTEPPEPPEPAEPRLTVATFNALGANHTKPRGTRPDYPEAPSRTRGLIDLVRKHRPDVLGLQELQRVQLRTVQRRLGDRFGVSGDLDNSILWRRSELAVVARTTLTIPYFGGEPRRMPVVRLRHRDTGRVVTVLNVHNPASVRGNAASYRDEAVAIERAFVTRERAKGRVVFLVGDLNAREEAFCPLSEGGLMASANGGSHVDGVCTPPSDLRIDWVFGADVEFDGYVVDLLSRRRQISDHPFVVASATFSGRARS
jgi:endonuclease/exonuclease/phosphatase family metal-dependent hydrolase